MLSERKIAYFQWICAGWIVAVGFIALTFRYCLFTWLMLFLLVLPPLVLAAVPIAATTVGIRKLMKRNYRESLPWLLVPVTGAAVATVAYRTGDDVIFWVHRPIYDGIVRDVAAGQCSQHNRASWRVRVDLVNCGSPVIVVIPWGGFLSSWYGVVYDAADQIPKAPAQRLQQWQATEAGNTLKYSSAWRALGGHYYFAGGDY